jgi:Fur family transcriptional regulator, ferric uptake regulator
MQLSTKHGKWKMMSNEIDVFTKYLKRRGLRYTREREIVIKEIFSRHDHFDVDTLYLRLRNKGINISKASVYRTIPLLMETGLIQEVFHEDGHMHYEHIYGHQQHCHLRCLQCGNIIEFKDDNLDQLTEKLAQQFEFDIKGLKLDIVGICPKCRTRI